MFDNFFQDPKFNDPIINLRNNTNREINNYVRVIRNYFTLERIEENLNDDDFIREYGIREFREIKDSFEELSFPPSENQVYLRMREKIDHLTKLLGGVHFGSK
jgi:hypothetical protein